MKKIHIIFIKSEAKNPDKMAIYVDDELFIYDEYNVWYLRGFYQGLEKSGVKVKKTVKYVDTPTPDLIKREQERVEAAAAIAKWPHPRSGCMGE